MYYWVIVFLLVFFLNPVFGETYTLEIDEKPFQINYSFDGEVIAMEIDNELTSLLIGTKNVQKDSIFTVSFHPDLISAENKAFVVLVNGNEVNYSIYQIENRTEIKFWIPVFTEEIEIIGTRVIPEFPIGSLIIFGVITAVSILIPISLKNFRW